MAGVDRADPRRSGPVSYDDLQTATRVSMSLQDCGLRADVQYMPTLECIDRLVRHETHVRGLEVERLRTTPVEPHDRIKRRGH